MSATLRPEDRDAVDLLLDGSRSVVGFSAGANVDAARLSAAHDVLHLLDLLPTEEPANDLLTRTLSRVGADAPATQSIPAFATAAGQQAHA